MAFHSFTFIIGVLPACYLGFVLAHRVGGWATAFRFLAAASLAFYAQFSLTLLAILLASVAGNYAFGSLIIASRTTKAALSRALLAGGIAANLAALGYLKYANFLIDIANHVSGGLEHIALIVPIGVSFYTFIQIGFLIEAHAGQIAERPGFGSYLLFATFFPCVTAGPLVQPRELLDQMHGRTDQAFNPAALATGLTIFAIGLFKKVVLADNLAPYVNAVFAGVEAGQPVAASIAWLGSVSYALQLYFDFSGYSDMAIGLACMFGLKLPLNFDSPFKATNISDFWRRWHMTMTRFFTTYIFTPMAMGAMRRSRPGESALAKFVKTAAMPAVVTFLVAGIWHGAGWTFVVYGLVHGLAIAVFTGWSRITSRRLPAPVGWLLTMSVVVSALVIFRAPDLWVAGRLLASMWSFGWLDHAVVPGVAVVGLDVRTVTSLIVVLGAIVLLSPNSQQILHRFPISSDRTGTNAPREAGLLAWRPTLAASLAVGLVLCLSLGAIGDGSTFLYYQF